MENKCLKGTGEWDYDFKNDILFFKVKGREYLKSIEANNVVLDLDSEEFLTGIQIFEASEFLRVNKLKLREIPNWKFEAKVEDNRIEVRLVFQVKVRNQVIEMNPIITQPVGTELPNSMLICN